MNIKNTIRKIKNKHNLIKKRDNTQTIIKDAEIKNNEEYRKEVETLAEKRYNIYKEMINKVHIAELQFKKEIQKIYKKDEKEQRARALQKMKDKIITQYNIDVKPIDNKLQNIRIELVEYNTILLDKRLE